MWMRFKSRGSELGRFRSLFHFFRKDRWLKLHQNLVWKRALFQTLPAYKSKRLASALMSGPLNRVWRWDSSRGAPSWRDSGHFIRKKNGGENYIKTWCEKEPFLRLCRSIKERDSIQQPEDWFQGLRIGYVDEIQDAWLRVGAIQVIFSLFQERQVAKTTSKFGVKKSPFSDSIWYFFHFIFRLTTKNYLISCKFISGKKYR